MNFYKNYKSVSVNCINEPLKETDEVYVISDGKLYKWDNTVTNTTDIYLEHFKEVPVYDYPQIFKSCSFNSSVSFLDVVENIATENKIKYESNSNKPVKTESHLLNCCIENRSVFPKSHKELSLKDDLSGLVEWIIKVYKDATNNATDDSVIINVVNGLIPKGCTAEYLRDVNILKQVLTGSLTVSIISDDNVNRLFSIIKAVKDYCDKIKAAKESKKQSNAKEDNKASSAKEDNKASAKEEKKQQDNEEVKSNEAA